MNYSYIKCKPLNKEEKRNLYISVATQRHLINPNLASSKKRLVNSLLSFLLSPNTNFNSNLVSWLLSYGSPQLIQKLISELSGAGVDTKKMTLDTIKNADPEHILLKEYITPDIQIIQTVPHPKTALVCFTGNGLNLNIPIQLFHTLAHDQFDLIIYLRDSEKQHFTNGLQGVAKDQAELNTFLRKKIPINCHISVVSASSGGYAAINFAEEVRANRVALFSPPLMFKNVAAINHPTKMGLDNVRLYFGCSNKFDLRLASQWKHTDYAHSRRWFNTKSHTTLNYLFERKEIGALFEWLLIGKEIPCMQPREILLVKAMQWFKHQFKRII